MPRRNSSPDREQMRRSTAGQPIDETRPEPEAACLPESPGWSQDRGGELLLPGLEFPPDPQLLAQGWERRFMADPARAEESAGLYRSLGFEVLAQPVLPAELSSACSDCRLVVCKVYVTIYTRRE